MPLLMTIADENFIDDTLKLLAVQMSSRIAKTRRKTYCLRRRITFYKKEKARTARNDSVKGGVK